MNHSNYFADHNKQFVVKNAKHLAKSKKEDQKEHPLQREFLDMLKSLDAYDAFEEAIFILPIPTDINTYCTIFKPEHWLDSNAKGYQEWFNYLRQYHPDALPKKSSKAPQDFQEQFSNPILNRFKRLLSTSGKYCCFMGRVKDTGTTLNKKGAKLNVWEILDAEYDPEGWLTNTFDWGTSEKEAADWVKLDAKWQTILKEEFPTKKVLQYFSKEDKIKKLKHFLKQKNVLTSFNINLCIYINENNPGIKTLTVDKCWDHLTENDDIHSWISLAFQWSTTKNRELWLDLNTRWKDICDKDDFSIPNSKKEYRKKLKAFLEERGLFEDYQKNIMHHCFYSEEQFPHLHERLHSIFKSEAKSWIANAFDWIDTKEFDVWNELNDEWVQLLKKEKENED